MEEEIDFEPAPASTSLQDEEEKKKKYPYPDKEKLSELQTKFETLEALVTKLASAIEELKKPKEPEKKEEKYPPKELSDVNKAVLEIKQQFESMSKKVEQFENKPVRISSQTSAETTSTEADKFLSELTGGEMLVYAEKKKMKWGQGD